jgi:arylsulfatase A-like enzyme
MAALRATAWTDNTLVVFTSDNGGERFSDNWPLVGGKMDLTEGGIRVPWIAHWPAVIAPGGVSAQQCMTMDWSATMLDAAGRAADPATRWTASRCCRCCSDATTSFRRPLFWRMNHRGQRALRDGDWKYLRVDGHDYLFNIPADERERANLARPRARTPGGDARRRGRPGTPPCRRSRRRHRQPGLRACKDMPQRSSLYLPGLPGWEALTQLLVPAMVIALVSFLETASSAKIEART